MTDDPYDRDAYVRDLIAHRVPGIAAADVDALASPLPLDEIIAFCDAVAERLTRIEIRLADKASEEGGVMVEAVGEALDKRVRAILEAIDECRKLTGDLAVEDKLLVVDRLTTWVALEQRPAEEPQTDGPVKVPVASREAARGQSLRA